jgi:hypothetical protein
MEREDVCTGPLAILRQLKRRNAVRGYTVVRVPGAPPAGALSLHRQLAGSSQAQLRRRGHSDCDPRVLLARSEERGRAVTLSIAV